MIEKILIIEDDPFFSKQMLRALRRRFPTIRFNLTETAEAARRELEKEQYDLIISDLLLPDSEGTHVTELVNAGEKVLVITGGADEIITNEMLHLNIVDFILKGVDRHFDYLIRIIRRLQGNVGKRILVIEGNESPHESYRKMLESQFLEVLSVRNGAEGLSRLKEVSIDLVLSDSHMPDISGYELLRAVRKSYTMVEMPFIALSSTEKNDNVALFLKMGANDYLKKPFTKEELLCRINTMLDTIDMLRELRHSAMSDALTGLRNRRYFYEVAPRLISVARRYEKQPLSIIMIDIDHFKRFNDTYGHQMGDMVLQKVAQTLKNNLRESDISIRFGGEEFLVMMPGTDLKRAFIAAEKLRRKVAEAEVVTPEGEKLHITISGGVAQYRPGMDLDDLVKAADDALYKAKAAGRNRIEIADQEG